MGGPSSTEQACRMAVMQLYRAMSCARSSGVGGPSAAEAAASTSFSSVRRSEAAKGLCSAQMLWKAVKVLKMSGLLAHKHKIHVHAKTIRVPLHMLSQRDCSFGVTRPETSQYDVICTRSGWPLHRIMQECKAMGKQDMC